MKRTLKQGFTLVEMLVAIAIFATIMTLAASVFIRALTLQRYAFNLQTAQENANFELEFMAKEIRTSTVASLPNSACLVATDPTLTIVNQAGETIVYGSSGNNLTRTVNGTSTIMNSNTVQFTKVGFCVRGAATGDLRQPQITIVAQVKTPNLQQQAVVDVQTTLSLRTISD